jgi:carbonic anhydrase
MPIVTARPEDIALDAGHGRLCSCRETEIGRRRLLQGIGAMMTTTVLPLGAMAQQGGYEAMLLSCIDPRMVTPVYDYMQRGGLAGKYSQFVIAGAAVAVVAPKFANWRPAFWDNLGATIQLHQIKRIIAIDHRDCGATRIAYGDAAIATPQKETETHQRVLAELRKELSKRHPQLIVVTGLMALDGSLEMLG